MKRASLLLSIFLLTGCSQKLGPYHLENDSIHYNQALQTSIDSQLLLNIVRMRYRDTPAFLNVGVISSAYERKVSLSSDFKFDAINKGTVTSITPKVSFDRTEKPTTTYQPLRGEGFVREFLSPISIQSLVLMNSSGWNIDRILRCCVQRMNKLRNAPTASGPTPKDAPEFLEFAELMRIFKELERNDAVDFVKARDPDSKDIDVYLVFDEDCCDLGLMNQIWTLLDIEPGLYRIKLAAAHGKSHKPDEVNVDLRSPISMLYFLANGVHVPYRDLMTQVVTCTTDVQGQQFDWQQVLDGVMTIHSGPLAGRCPAAMVHYRGTNFFIDDSDLESKATFSLLAQLLALQVGCPDLPVTTLTIPLTN